MTRKPVVLGTAIAALALAGAAAIATAAEGDGTIHACKHLRHGLVRIVLDAGACKSNEAALSWNQHGPKGDPGEPGPAGPPGPKGDSGAALTSIDGLTGTACKTFDGASGKVQIGATATDLITLTCETEATPPPPPPPAGAKLVINEVDYDQVGADTGGYVEIANAGEATVDLAGIALVLVNGGDGTEYGRKTLTGTLAPGAYLVIDVDPQNGAPDGLALIDTASGALLDALSYEGEIHAATIGGKTYDLVEGTPLPVTVADSNTEDGALARIPDRADTNNAATDWKFTTTRTPGAANVLTP